VVHDVNQLNEGASKGSGFRILAVVQRNAIGGRPQQSESEAWMCPPAPPRTSNNGLDVGPRHIPTPEQRSQTRRQQFPRQASGLRQVLNNCGPLPLNCGPYAENLALSAYKPN